MSILLWVCGRRGGFRAEIVGIGPRIRGNPEGIHPGPRAQRARTRIVLYPGHSAVFRKSVNATSPDRIHPLMHTDPGSGRANHGQHRTSLKDEEEKMVPLISGLVRDEVQRPSGLPYSDVVDPGSESNVEALHSL
jgi:hypothetical protein